MFQTDKHCIRMQAMHPHCLISLVYPEKPPAQPLDPRSLRATQPTSCPHGAPGWAISHNHRPKHIQEGPPWARCILGLSLPLIPSTHNRLLHYQVKVWQIKADFNTKWLTSSCPGNYLPYTTYIITGNYSYKNFLCSFTSPFHQLSRSI